MKSHAIPSNLWLILVFPWLISHREHTWMCIPLDIPLVRLMEYPLLYIYTHMYVYMGWNINWSYMEHNQNLWILSGIMEITIEHFP